MVMIVLTLLFRTRHSRLYWNAVMVLAIPATASPDRSNIATQKSRRSKAIAMRGSVGDAGKKPDATNTLGRF